MANSFGSRAILTVGDRSYTIHRLDAVYKKLPDAARLPFSLKILLENLLRTEDGLPSPRRTSKRWRSGTRSADADRGDRLHAEPRAAAGLHRRAVRRRSGRHARRDDKARRRSRRRSTRCSPSNW